MSLSAGCYTAIGRSLPKMCSEPAHIRPNETGNTRGSSVEPPQNCSNPSIGGTCPNMGRRGHLQLKRLRGVPTVGKTHASALCPAALSSTCMLVRGLWGWVVSENGLEMCAWAVSCCTTGYRFGRKMLPSAVFRREDTPGLRVPGPRISCWKPRPLEFTKVSKTCLAPGSWSKHTFGRQTFLLAFGPNLDVSDPRLRCSFRRTTWRLIP